MSIRRLPPHLVNRIAAGEVVERPASALKELVENSIDAGASRIAVAIGQGGIGRIEVADDGCGMSADEMALALERHCTSKLPDEAIESVVTLGFRGEALPSIASVARVTIESRPAGRDGWSRVVDNGEVLRDGPAAVPPGTRIVVEDLFARVPARRKFLRAPRSESAAGLEQRPSVRGARPDIGFRLVHDARGGLTVPGGEERPGRVAALTDRALAENSVAIDWVRDTVSLGGVAGLPTFNRGIA
ncbi:DNA mismatch repair endonuclease MutL, partial [Sphingomonas sp. RB1R13]|uniref:DNA mismatch repair endonuclease MutL n=1 Tax=Sphingomonas sp. RB1R13 TaxID=3096159 RepID=UPI002FCB8B6E